MNYRHSLSRGQFRRRGQAYRTGRDPAASAQEGTAFAVIDSHAGQGFMTCRAPWRPRLAKRQNRIATADRPVGRNAGGAFVYLSLVKGNRNGSVGDSRSDHSNCIRSPLIAASCCGRRSPHGNRKHPEEFAALRQVLAPYRNAAANRRRLCAYPEAAAPPSRRDWS